MTECECRPPECECHPFECECRTLRLLKHLISQHSFGHRPRPRRREGRRTRGRALRFASARPASFDQQLPSCRNRITWLPAIRSHFMSVAIHEPELLHKCQRVLALLLKCTEKRVKGLVRNAGCGYGYERPDADPNEERCSAVEATPAKPCKA